MGRNMDRRDRCQECLMKTPQCLCPLLVPAPSSSLPHKTHITLLMHKREFVQTTNTGRLALRLLKNSDIYFRGVENLPLNPESILKKDHSPLYLYPSEDSQTLSLEFLESQPRPIQLLVPDGTWRQTKRVSKREPWIQAIPHVKLPNTENSLFFLRKKVRSDGISTFEAIARALGILESSELQYSMEQIFSIMVERTLQTRGKKMEHYL